MTLPRSYREVVSLDMNRVVASMTLTQGVAEHIRSLIHRGEVGPGDRLPAERDLAEQLGVARFSLREALRILADDGYVEVRRGAHGGTFVTELRRPVEAWRARMREQPGEIDDIFDFRITLESNSARLAAVRRTPGDLNTLSSAIDRLAQADGRAAFRLADSQFHDGLAHVAGNTRLEAAIHTVRGELFSPHDLLAFVEPVEENRRDHQAIYEAVRDGDPDAAELRMREHLDNARRQVGGIVFGSEGSLAESRI
ncbi:MAG: FCD domain-containing protein [Actinophytocola sp.]|nr:FCD domain-containing protein [Actinophytocola sp.]